MKRFRRPAFVWVALLALLLQGCQSLPRHQGPGCCPPTACVTPPLHGVFPTVLSPYGCDGIDIDSLTQQLQYQLAGGVHGLLVLGTIGEGKYLSDNERGQVIQTAVNVAAGRVPVIVGIHTTDVNVALAQMEQAKKLGASAVLVKYSGHPRASFSSVLGFYAALSQSGILPILYYHFPADTGLRLTAQEVAVLLGLPNVIGIKESTLDLNEVQTHIQLTAGQDKAFLSGTALNLTQFLELGGHGVMAPEPVLLPARTVAAYEAYRGGNFSEARRLQKELFVVAPVVSTSAACPCLTRCLVMKTQDHHIALPLRSDCPQARMKEALNHLGIRTPTYTRPPLPALSAHDARKVQHALRRAQTLDVVYTPRSATH